MYIGAIPKAENVDKYLDSYPIADTPLPLSLPSVPLSIPLSLPLSLSTSLSTQELLNVGNSSSISSSSSNGLEKTTTTPTTSSSSSSRSTLLPSPPMSSRASRSSASYMNRKINQTSRTLDAGVGDDEGVVSDKVVVVDTQINSQIYTQIGSDVNGMSGSSSNSGRSSARRSIKNEQTGQAGQIGSLLQPENGSQKGTNALSQKAPSSLFTPLLKRANSVDR